MELLIDQILGNSDFMWNILITCPISIPPEKVRKPEVSWDSQGDIEMEHWRKLG